MHTTSQRNKRRREVPNMVAHSHSKGKCQCIDKPQNLLMEEQRKWNIVASSKRVVNES